MDTMTRLSLVLLLCNSAVVAGAQDPLAAIVRTTEPLTPQEQLHKFHLPDGFEIQLFAAEPDIQKPMNLAFDAQGRLWVSGSVEYPFAAKEGEGRDSIRVLQDADGDGRAEQITTFVEGLNIPIGLYPYRDGVVAYSIPHIYFFRDADGDDRCDRREVLYGPLGDPVDTHGMQNAFRRGFDGWLYICHGFRNASVIRGRDGSEIRLESGNTYRVRLDGSRVEQFTWGQVNPFGSTFTPAGDLITADCHSLPLSLLLRGGYYSSFGKPHDGLGFVPPIMRHSHGSTAISGAAFYDADHFPEPYRGSLFVGNVMTSRVHRDAVVMHGSTLEAREEQDFLTCDDPWFRPVDLQIGPDGALYVADFYNRIIGHYEVPLDHPQRDHTRGRIWRVVYRGTEQHVADGSVNLAQANAQQLVATLGSASMTQRMLAADQLADRVGAAAPELRQAAAQSEQQRARVHALWVLHRLGQLRVAEMASAACASEELVRVHAMRLLAESAEWSDEHRALALAGLQDASPLVRRSAADAVGQHPDPTALVPLLEALARVSEVDVHLRQAILMALRNQLRQPHAFAQLPPLAPTLRSELCRVALAVPAEEAATFLIQALADGLIAPDQVPPHLKHAASYAPAGAIDHLVDLARQKAGDNVDFQVELIQLLQQQLTSRGLRETSAVNAWGGELAERLLREVPSSGWTTLSPQNPWGLERRNCADGVHDVTFLSSLPGGEQATGVLRSADFKLPARLSFFLCGHLGFPASPAREGNLVRLRLVGTDQIIQQASPPRNDVAQQVTWDLGEHAGQSGYLELVDGIALSAYAWLAVSRFEPAVVSLPTTAPLVATRRRMAAAAIAKALKLAEVRERLVELAGKENTEPALRVAAAEALLALRPQPVGEALLVALRDPILPLGLQVRWAHTLCDGQEAELEAALREAMQSVPTRLQEQMAEQLATTSRGAELLLRTIEEGKASPRLLQRVSVERSLRNSGLENVKERIEQLTSGLPPASEQLAALLASRSKGFGAAQPSASRGQELFTKHCAACHQVAGKGAVVGPQLDGIGNRGLERVMEDLLDPNRDIDGAFHVSLLATTDGRVLTGLFRRVEAKSRIYAGKDGKEFSVLSEEIEEERKSRTSIMPDNFGTLLAEAECYDLLAYLLALRTPAKPE